MPRYTKTWWEKAKQFKIESIEIQDVLRMLEKCRTKEEKFCLLLLYYTGARPSEILEIKKQDIVEENDLIKIQVPTKKGGVGRSIYLPKNDYTNYILEYVESSRGKLTKKLQFSWQVRDFIYRVSNKELTPYFFRHNRFSKLAKRGASRDELKYLKGAKDVRSVEDYIHIGGQETKKLANIID